MKNPPDRKRHPGSFRDPSGFIFFQDGILYRLVSLSYRDDYEHLMRSGLYKTLIDEELLVPHQEADKSFNGIDNVYKVLKPEVIPFISYPFEWSFSQLKHAALTTLRVQKRALEFGMSLKDCSAYNIQFRKGKPILIDTLSFEKYREGQPWLAYRQFCQHFLGPLALMSYRDIRLSNLLRTYIDGIPLDLTSSLLPFRTRLLFSLLSHIHLHAHVQRHYSHRPFHTKARKLSKTSLLALFDNLESAVKKLKWTSQKTEWVDYYRAAPYSERAILQKKCIVSNYLDKVSQQIVWDLGANTGPFSRIASQKGVQTISFDIDPACVERNYLECLQSHETNILPLLLDLTNPSPGIGWENQERMSLLDRGPADTVMALALIHHLAISNNLPLDKIAAFFKNICTTLIIEYIPKNDPQSQILLSSRRDIFSHYTQADFERSFSNYFTFICRMNLVDSQRSIYLLERRS
jgi:hypothetical protein